MSDECNKFGNPNATFYFKGRFFEKQEDFWEYLQEWPLKIADQESFKREWDTLGIDIWSNISILRIEISNGAVNNILQKNFLRLLEEFYGEIK